MAIMKFEKFLPRAASVIAVTSLVSCRHRGSAEREPIPWFPC